MVWDTHTCCSHCKYTYSYSLPSVEGFSLCCVTLIISHKQTWTVISFPNHSETFFEVIFRIVTHPAVSWHTATEHVIFIILLHNKSVAWCSWNKDLKDFIYLIWSVTVRTDGVFVLHFFHCRMFCIAKIYKNVSHTVYDSKITGQIVVQILALYHTAVHEVYNLNL